MKKQFFSLIAIFLICLTFPQNAFADDPTAGNYNDIHFPQWVKDVRRTEIITFGSLPFVTLWTTVGYSLYTYGEFKNPLDKSTSSFTEADQWNIIKISAATCLALGLTDLTINLISRSRKENRLRKQMEKQPFTIVPSKEIKLMEEESDKEAAEKLKKELEIEKNRQNELPEGVESAIF